MKVTLWFMKENHALIDDDTGNTSSYGMEEVSSIPEAMYHVILDEHASMHCSMLNQHLVITQRVTTLP